MTSAHHHRSKGRDGGIADFERREIGVVIVPMDFSRASLAALAFAESIVAGTSRRIRLLHAVPAPALEEVAPAQQALVDAASSRLEDLAAPLRRRGIAVDAKAATGAPVDLVEIAVREARAEGVEALVALGDRGLSALRRAILGSVADAVLRRVDGPVIVTHERDEPAGRMRVVVAYGFDQEGGEALGAFVELFAPRAGGVLVELVHALPELDWTEGTDAPLLRTAFTDEFERRRCGELEEVAARLRMRGFAAEAFLVRGEPARAVLAHATAARADLVVSGRRHRRAFERVLLGSTAEGIVHRARCAVLTSGLARSAVPGPKVAIIA
jgi:nucleotide-binding universal stress UspA family protein